MKKFALGLLLGVILGSAVLNYAAQSPPHEMAAPMAGPYLLFYADSSTLLLNTQTGQTWMLVLQGAPDTSRYVFAEIYKIKESPTPNRPKF